MKIWERIKIAFCCRSKCSLNEEYEYTNQKKNLS